MTKLNVYVWVTPSTQISLKSFGYTWAWIFSAVEIPKVFISARSVRDRCKTFSPKFVVTEIDFGKKNLTYINVTLIPIVYNLVSETRIKKVLF